MGGVIPTWVSAWCRVLCSRSFRASRWRLPIHHRSAAPVLTMVWAWVVSPQRGSGTEWALPLPDGSVLGNGSSEVLERHVLGLRAAALTRVEAVDRGELLGGEVEVEDVDVLGDPLRLGRLWDDRAALLQTPAQHHLGGGLAVALGDLADDRILKGACVLTVAVEGDAADRRPRLSEEAVFGVRAGTRLARGRAWRRRCSGSAWT